MLSKRAQKVLGDCEPGLRATAFRMVHAEKTFLKTLMTLGGISESDAEKVLAVYRKNKIVKMDSVNGVMSVKHGAFLDRDVILRALKS